MAKAKITSSAKASRTKANSDPIPESSVSSSADSETLSQNAAATKANTNTNKNQVAQSAAGIRVPAKDVAVVSFGTTPVEAVAETKTAAKNEVGTAAKSEAAIRPSAETKPATEARRLEVVKPESRKNTVVPINLEDEIRRRAYELYAQRGSMGGSEAEDWLRAEREIRQRYQQKQQSA